MMQPYSSHHDATHRVVVEVPRAGDAIGGALRGAFARERALPDEFAKLLATIDRNCDRD